MVLNVMSSPVETLISIKLTGTAALDHSAIEELATELTAAVEAEPGSRGYRWSRVPNTHDWTIEEQYADEAALVDHLRHMKEGGLLRRLGGALKVNNVEVLSGDDVAVRKILGFPSAT
jgi:hypothetical protein